MGHFKISTQTHRQLFEQGSPMTDIYKRRKLGPIHEVAQVLEAEWCPESQKHTSVKLI